VLSAKAQIFLKKSESEQFAERRCRLEHRVATNSYLSFLPTNVRGFTNIGDLNAQLAFECEPKEESGYVIAVEVEFQSNPNLIKQVSSQQFPIRVQQLNFGNSKADNGIQVGLLWDPWVRSAHQIWRYHLTQNDFRSIVSRVGLLPDQEIGAQIQTVTEAQELVFRISSGESWPNPELGPNKDFTVWWKTRESSSSHFYFMIYGRYGRVDFVARESNEKSRSGIQIAYLGENGFRTYLSAMRHRSGVDGLNYQQQSPRITPQFGEGMDLVPLGGQRINGLAGDWFFSYLLDGDRKFEIFYRISETRLNLADRSNYLISNQSGFAFKMKSNARVVVFLSSTEYGEGFLVGTQNRQMVGVSLEAFEY